MSRSDTWCDHIIMQAVANALCCVMHITNSNVTSAEATVITPVCSKVIFLGYIDDLHYVSAVQKKCGWRKNSLRKRKNKRSMPITQYTKIERQLKKLKKKNKQGKKI